MCVFCDFYKKNSELIIYENDLVFVILDKFKVKDGHSLIIPKRHFEDFFSSTTKEVNAIYDALQYQKQNLDTIYSPDGFNVGINIGKYAGQKVMHLHIHLVPRHKGDMGKLVEPRGLMHYFRTQFK